MRASVTSIHLVDVFKFVCALMVVGIHTQPFRYHDTIQIWLFWPIVSIAVPYFLIVSSYFFWIKDNPSIKKYLKRIGTLYLVWLVIDIPMIYKEMVENGAPAYVDAFLFLRGFFFGQTYSGSWYLSCSIWAMSISFLVWKRGASTKSLLLFGFILYAVGKILLYFRAVLPDLIQYPANRFYVYYGVMQISTFTYFIFVFMGFMMVKNKRVYNVFKSKMCFFVGLIITVFELCFNHVYDFPISVVAPLIVIPFLLVYSMSTPLPMPDMIALRLRKMSTLVFFIHPTFVRLCPPLGDAFVMEHPILNYFVVVIISVVIAYIISSSRLSKLVPIMKHLY